MTGTPRPQKRLAELDALRGLAALSVVVHHYALLFRDSQGMYANVDRIVRGVERTPLYVFFAGNEAVILFFILSGFVLSLPFIQGKEPPYKAYALKRICRIYLPYLFTLLVAVALHALLQPTRIEALGTWFNRIWSQPSNLYSVVSHIVFIGDYDHGEIMPVTWSLIHEMRISLLLPVMLWALVGRSISFQLGVAFLLSAVGIVATYVLQTEYRVQTDYLMSLHYAAFFIIGALLAAHMRRITRWFGALSLASKIALAASAVVAYCYAHFIPYPLVAFSDWPVAWGAAVAIVFALGSPWAGRVLAVPLVRAMGDISYSLYLCHTVILIAMVHMLWGRWPLLLILLASLMLTFVASYAMYRWVEVPSMQLGRRLARRYGAARRDAPRNARGVSTL